MRNTSGNQIKTGTDVYGSDGEKIGSIAGVADNYFVIEKGFIFTTDIYVPMSAVARVDDDKVMLSMTKDQVENEDWTREPAEEIPAMGAAPTYTEPDTGAASAATDREVLERREERLVVDKDVEKAGDVRVGKRVVEEVEVGKAATTDTERVEGTVRREEIEIEAEPGTTPQNR